MGKLAEGRGVRLFGDFTQIQKSRSGSGWITGKIRPQAESPIRKSCPCMWYAWLARVVSVLAFHSCQSLSLSIQSHLTLWHPTLIGSKGCESTAAHMQIHATLATPMLIISLGWGRWGESDNELCLESQSTEQRPNLERCWHFLSFFLCMYLQSSWKRFHWYTRKVSSKRKYCRTWEWKTAH